jgi:RDD family
VLYLWLSWWLLGRSYGKHVMGIRVAGRRGRKLGPVRALARAAFCVFFPIGFFWCAISPRRHSIQDIAVYSAVTYDWMPRPAGHVAAHVDAAEPEQPPSPGEPGVEAPDPKKAPPRRYRWARAIDPYDD